MFSEGERTHPGGQPKRRNLPPPPQQAPLHPLSSCPQSNRSEAPHSLSSGARLGCTRERGCLEGSGAMGWSRGTAPTPLRATLGPVLIWTQVRRRGAD